MNRESLDALRQSLPALSAAGESSAALAEYYQYYGIDYEARIDGVQHDCGTVRSGSFALAVQRWQLLDARRNLLLVHGYTDHVGLFGHLVEFGLNQGFNVITFDLPGHGLSTGVSVEIDDFGDYSQAIANVLEAAALPDLPWCAMAQSTGCAALMDYARKYPWPFSATVFMAPLIRPAAWLRIRAGHFVLQRLKDRIAREFTQNSGDEAFLAFMRTDPMQSQTISVRWVGALRRWLAGLEFTDLGVGPMLVLQGDADGTVAWEYNMKRIVELFPECHIEMLPGAGHHLANETEEIRAAYLGKVSRFLDA